MNLTAEKIIVDNSTYEAHDEPATSSTALQTDDKVNRQKSKAGSERFRYGNFNRYYGVRLVGKEQHDPRLDFMQESWFRNRNVLDIGCNVGALTLTIAKEFAPRRIVGIDIDKNLIGIARKNIRHYCDAGEKLVGKLPASIVKPKGDDALQTNYKFPQNVWFYPENYVLTEDYMLDMVRPEFDVIMALSITKWIHLNWGDDGMRRFFRRVFLHLRPGGRFVLEPQDFAHYGRRARILPEMRDIYQRIRFRPDAFKDYLLSDEVGFESVEDLGIPQAYAKGFQRPILVFRKAIMHESSTGDGGTMHKRKYNQRRRRRERMNDGIKKPKTEGNKIDNCNGGDDSGDDFTNGDSANGNGTKDDDDCRRNCTNGNIADCDGGLSC